MTLELGLMLTLVNKRRSRAKQQDSPVTLPSVQLPPASTTPERGTVNGSGELLSSDKDAKDKVGLLLYAFMFVDSQQAGVMHALVVRRACP